MSLETEIDVLLEEMSRPSPPPSPPIPDSPASPIPDSPASPIPDSPASPTLLTEKSNNTATSPSSQLNQFPETNTAAPVDPRIQKAPKRHLESIYGFDVSPKKIYVPLISKQSIFFPSPNNLAIEAHTGVGRSQPNIPDNQQQQPWPLPPTLEEFAEQTLPTEQPQQPWLKPDTSESKAENAPGTPSLPTTHSEDDTTGDSYSDYEDDDDEEENNDDDDDDEYTKDNRKKMKKLELINHENIMSCKEGTNESLLYLRKILERRVYDIRESLVTQMEQLSLLCVKIIDILEELELMCPSLETVKLIRSQLAILKTNYDKLIGNSGQDFSTVNYLNPEKPFRWTRAAIKHECDVIASRLQLALRNMDNTLKFGAVKTQSEFTFLLSKTLPGIKFVQDLKPTFPLTSRRNQPQYIKHMDYVLYRMCTEPHDFSDELSQATSFPIVACYHLMLPQKDVKATLLSYFAKHPGNNYLCNFLHHYMKGKPVAAEHLLFLTLSAIVNSGYPCTETFNCELHADLKYHPATDSYFFVVTQPKVSIISEELPTYQTGHRPTPDFFDTMPRLIPAFHMHKLHVFRREVVTKFFKAAKTQNIFSLVECSHPRNIIKLQKYAASDIDVPEYIGKMVNFNFTTSKQCIMYVKTNHNAVALQ